MAIGERTKRCVGGSPGLTRRHGGCDMRLTDTAGSVVREILA